VVAVSRQPGRRTGAGQPGLFVRVGYRRHAGLRASLPICYSLIFADYPGNANAIAGRQAVAKKMTPVQLSEAPALVQNWKPK